MIGWRRGKRLDPCMMKQVLRAERATGCQGSILRPWSAGISHLAWNGAAASSTVCAVDAALMERKPGASHGRLRGPAASSPLTTTTRSQRPIRSQSGVMAKGIAYADRDEDSNRCHGLHILRRRGTSSFCLFSISPACWICKQSCGVAGRWGGVVVRLLACLP